MRVSHYFLNQSIFHFSLLGEKLDSESALLFSSAILHFDGSEWETWESEVLLSGCFYTAVLIWLPKPHLAGSQHGPARRRAFIQFESSECTRRDAAQVLTFWTTTLALLCSLVFFSYSFCMLKIFIFRDWKNMLHPLLSSRSAFLLLFIRFFSDGWHEMMGIITPEATLTYHSAFQTCGLG